MFTADIAHLIILCVALVSLTLNPTESRQASSASPAHSSPGSHLSEIRNILWWLPMEICYLWALLPLPASAHPAIAVASGSLTDNGVWGICLPPSPTENGVSAVLFVYFLCWFVGFHAHRHVSY